MAQLIEQSSYVVLRNIHTCVCKMLVGCLEERFVLARDAKCDEGTVQDVSPKAICRNTTADVLGATVLELLHSASCS